MKISISEIEFKNEGSYLDVTIHNEEKWIELKIDVGETFALDYDDWKILRKRIDRIFRDMERNGQSSQ